MVEEVAAAAQPLMIVALIRSASTSHWMQNRVFVMGGERV